MHFRLTTIFCIATCSIACANGGDDYNSSSDMPEQYHFANWFLSDPIETYSALPTGKVRLDAGISIDSGKSDANIDSGHDASYDAGNDSSNVIDAATNCGSVSTVGHCMFNMATQCAESNVDNSAACLAHAMPGIWNTGSCDTTNSTALVQDYVYPIGSTF